MSILKVRNPSSSQLTSYSNLSHHVPVDTTTFSGGKGCHPLQQEPALSCNHDRICFPNEYKIFLSHSRKFLMPCIGNISEVGAGKEGQLLITADVNRRPVQHSLVKLGSFTYGEDHENVIMGPFSSLRLRWWVNYGLLCVCKPISNHDFLPLTTPKHYIIKAEFFLVI